METQQTIRKPLKIIGIKPSRFSHKDFIKFIQSNISFSSDEPSEVTRNPEQGKSVEKYRSLDGHELICERTIKDQPGQMHVETYHHRDNLVILLNKKEKVFEYHSSQEWEYTTDGYDPQTEDTGVVRVYDQSDLSRKMEILLAEKQKSTMQH